MSEKRIHIGFEVDSSQLEEMNKIIKHLDNFNKKIDNKQNSGCGFRVSGKVSKKMDRIDLFIEPFFRYWHIDDSEKVYLSNREDGTKKDIQFIEPDNSTKEAGIKLGMTF